jgi:hypothetical protein
MVDFRLLIFRKRRVPEPCPACGGSGRTGGGEVLTSKEIAEKTVLYAVSMSIVNRNEVLCHSMEEAGTPIPRPSLSLG